MADTFPNNYMIVMFKLSFPFHSLFFFWLWLVFKQLFLDKSLSVQLLNLSSILTPSVCFIFAFRSKYD